MTTLKSSVLFFGVLAASLFGQAPARAPKTPIFISPTLADAVVLITPPPKLDSKRMKQDVTEIIAIHRAANPQEIERANWDNKHENLFAIANVLGDRFTEESLPATAKLWANGRLVVVDRDRWHRSAPGIATARRSSPDKWSRSHR